MLDQTVITEKKKSSVGGMTVFTLLIIFLVIAGIIVVMRAVGKHNLTTAAVGLEEVAITIDGASTTVLGEDGVTEEELPEGHIIYQDTEYALNTDLITILVMGIDRETVTEIGGQSWDTDENSVNNGGQADALFLLLLNPHDKTVSIVGINRNTMAEVDVWDDEGNYKGIYTQQIALQHGYGDGGEESCLRQVKAVSRLMKGIPINSYAAISMDAIPELNDAVGGVTVEVLDDIVYPEYEMDLHQGDEVTLMGEKAYWYVRLRNENVFNSNALRLERQKQYLTTFAAKAKEKVGDDIRVALELYRILSKYMVTDIDAGSFSYLVGEALGYKFDIDRLYTLEGETLMGSRFEEFYPDQDALQKLVLKLFYEEVEE